MAEQIARVVALILERPTCAECIARRGAMTPTKVDEALTMIQQVLELRAEPAPCRTCGKTRLVFSTRRVLRPI